MIRRKKRPGYISIFTKSVAAFFCLGLFPFMLLGLGSFQKNLSEVTDSAVNHASQTAKSVSREIEVLTADILDGSKSLYESQFSDYGYFYDVILNPDLSEILRENLIEDALKNILYGNNNIAHVYLIDREGRLYSSTRAPEKIVNEAVMRMWGDKHFKEEKNKVSVIPTHSPEYFRNTDLPVITFSRNIMNTKSLKLANTDILATLYVDVPVECLDGILIELELDHSSEVLITDDDYQVMIYSNYNSSQSFLDDQTIWDSGGTSFIKTNREYFVGCPVSGTAWRVFVRLPFSNFEKMYRSLVESAVYLLGISALLLCLLYVYNSRTISRPIRALKEGMDCIKAGDLAARVDITSRDELGILADGLNNMAEQLQKHIDQVYLSEIRQKEAQLIALTAQIQPHYLYNTLDAIRMSAIMNDDKDTALMLESLSSQMRYLIGNNKGLVSLKEELDSINNYFIIVKLRYENHVKLEITADEDALTCMIPRLTLQPLIENSVKYGIVPKESGTIAIYAKKAHDSLEITVIDDGNGMNEETLRHVQNVLRGLEKQEETEGRKFSIGLKNVEERIKLNFGEEYGMDISSTPGLGTLVRCRLPVLEGEEESDVYCGDSR